MKNRKNRPFDVRENVREPNPIPRVFGGVERGSNRGLPVSLPSGDRSADIAGALGGRTQNPPAFGPYEFESRPGYNPLVSQHVSPRPLTSILPGHCPPTSGRKSGNLRDFRLALRGFVPSLLIVFGLAVMLGVPSIPAKICGLVAFFAGGFFLGGREERHSESAHVKGARARRTEDWRGLA